jgi:hypothetical protein
MFQYNPFAYGYSGMGFTDAPAASAAPTAPAPKKQTPLQVFLQQSSTGGDGEPAEGGPPASNSASRYGVYNTTPVAVASLFDPTGLTSLGAMGMKANNISKIRGIQSSLGMPNMNPAQWGNPFSRAAGGSTTASLGNFNGTPVSFGGIVEGPFGGNLSTSFTPQEAVQRQNVAKGLTQQAHDRARQNDNAASGNGPGGQHGGRGSGPAAGAPEHGWG